jgi:EAL domain-containing protein (putative c-di-GMP-specific phosphodiesterase class I)/GGDEF domain-containing protein
MAAHARLVQAARRGLIPRAAGHRNVKPELVRSRRDVPGELRRVLEEKTLRTVFQPIFGFREGHIVGYEALVRGPEGSPLQTPTELFAAAAEEGVAVELNILCVQQILRAFAERELAGSLFLNVSPRLIAREGFQRERATRFLEALGIDPARVVIELTEDYPTLDFERVHESLMLYRSMGCRVAIDDLGEGFASLRLWSQLRPEYVKADKHFVTGISDDPVKMQFLHAIQHIAENSGSLVIAEGIENAADFKIVKEIGIACGQGWFIGRPAERPAETLTAEAQLANADARVPVPPAARLRAGTEPSAHDFVRAVDPANPKDTLGAILDRFTASPSLAAIPVVGAGGIEGVVSRAWLELARAGAPAQALRARACIELADRTPIEVEAGLDLAALTAMLVESDAQRVADGFVILAKGRYLGMGSCTDVMRSLQGSRVLAARYTNPLTLLPGQVPINEHLERLLAGHVAFTAWLVEIDQMRGFNDSEGFAAGDALIHATARLLEEACQHGVDFAGHVAGCRFVMLVQSEDWKARAQGLLEAFAGELATHLPEAARERGYFTVKRRDGRDYVRPLPKLAIGILPVLPGVFESRHEVIAVAKRAAEKAQAQTAGAIYVDQDLGNAYPQSLLFDDE